MCLELGIKGHLIEKKLKSGEIRPQSAHKILRRKLPLFSLLDP
jgi:hypothetical protein